jgi:type II secretory pathway pseudopilin PulG
MNHPRPIFPVCYRHSRDRRTSGSTLPELLLAALVLLLAAGLALTGMDRLQRRRNCDIYVQDLRDIAEVFAGYHRQNNRWPPSSSAEIALPPDLARALAATAWSKGSPFGGSYAWVAPDPAAGHDLARSWGGRGAVTLTAFVPQLPLLLTRADLLRIDRSIDDANLATGRFRTGFNGWPVFLLEAAKR